jgi:SpoVK/Ycf46/Vps4 family AAA+-type ATPase
MTEPQPSPADLEQLDADYRAAKTRLAEIGFTCEGSLIERYTSCKNPNCRCADPEQRHGPYWQISWKEGGKTVSKMLPAQDAALYRQWIANRRALEQILNEMRDISHTAAQRVLAARNRPLIAPPRPRHRPA